MTTSAPLLDFSDPVALTAALVDIPSPSHHEEAIADLLDMSLRAALDHLGDKVEFIRHGNTVVVRSHLQREQRVILAGHIDTVPLADNVPHTMSRDEHGNEIMHGCGTVDMKSGLAVYAHTFVSLLQPENIDSLSYDLTLICYEGEEVASIYNGLGKIQEEYPELLEGDVALLGEPSGGVIEAGCQGTVRVHITAYGQRAHSARSWLGVNAVHHLLPVVQRVADYIPRQEVDIDGCVYREGLNVVRLSAGVADNTIPDHALAVVNFRFAPDRSVQEALDHLVEVIGLPISSESESAKVTALEPGSLIMTLDDCASAAHPGLHTDVVQKLITAVGGKYRAKYGWTDVARFGELGIPAVNFGSGDPGFAHKKDEQCPVQQIIDVTRLLKEFLVQV